MADKSDDNSRHSNSMPLAPKGANLDKDYFWIRTYQTGKTKGKQYYVYNWPLILKEVQKEIKRYAARGIQPNARKLYYGLWQANKFVSGSTPYKNLDDKLVEWRKDGSIKWGVLKDAGRETSNDYPDYWTPDEFLDNAIDKLKGVAEDYYYPRWYKQRQYSELWIEKEADVDDFRALVDGLEINVRKAKGFAGWEAAYHNFKNIVKYMAFEGVQKEVTIFYFGDMDPSGDQMGDHIREQAAHFADYDFGYRYRLGKVKTVRLGITMEQIAELNLALIPDKKVFDKLFGMSIAAGDDRDKPGDSRTTRFIDKYAEYMKEGQKLPPLAELAALFASDELIDYTRNLIREEINDLFDQELYEDLHNDDLQTDTEYIEDEVKKRVKFSDESAN